MKEVEVNIDSNVVRAQTRKLKAKWTMEAAEDLNPFLPGSLWETILDVLGRLTGERGVVQQKQLDRVSSRIAQKMIGELMKEEDEKEIASLKIWV